MQISFISLLFCLAFGLNALGTLAQTVYVQGSGSKYHQLNCHHIKGTGGAVSLADIADKKLCPCTKCKPPVNNKIAEYCDCPPPQATYCKGKTKEKQPCQQKTKHETGYCNSHRIAPK